MNLARKLEHLANDSAPDSPPPASLDRFERTFCIVVIGLLWLVRLYLSSQLKLVDDEAYYWDWSRHLSLSYFDHPGMIAWLIRLSTEIFGSELWAVRLPALVCHALAWLVLWRLATEMFDARVGRLVAVLYLLMPILGLASVLVTPDAPLALFWILALWTAWQIKSQTHSYFWQTGGWLLLGSFIGLGFLSKYTMALMALPILAWLAFYRQKTAAIKPENKTGWHSLWFWGALALAMALSAPAIIWNWERNWPSFYYHLIGRQTGGLSLTRWLGFWLSQVVFASPLLVAFIFSWRVGLRRWQDRRWQLIVLASAPIFAFFCLQSLLAHFKPHWPAPAYVFALVGAAALWSEGHFARSFTRARAHAAAALVVVFCALVQAAVCIEAFYPLAPKISRQLNSRWQSRWDPSNDFYGWDVLAKQLLSWRERLADAPALASWRYQNVAQLAYATGEKVWRVGGLIDSYRFEQDLTELTGRSVLYVNDNRYNWDPSYMFESCQILDRVEVTRSGERARDFELWYCKGFRGPQVL